MDIIETRSRIDSFIFGIGQGLMIVILVVLAIIAAVLATGVWLGYACVRFVSRKPIAPLSDFVLGWAGEIICPIDLDDASDDSK